MDDLPFVTLYGHPVSRYLMSYGNLFIIENPEALQGYGFYRLVPTGRKKEFFILNYFPEVK